jgi:hypothetical protein
MSLLSDIKRLITTTTAKAATPEPEPAKGVTVQVNGKAYQIPTSWQDVHWTMFERMINGGETSEVIAMLCGSDDPDLVNPVVVELLQFVQQLPLEAVLDKPVDLMLLECYINARSAYRADAKDYYGVVRAYWPVCPDDADTVMSRYYAIITAWNQLDTQFAILNTEPTAKEKSAGVERLAAFQEYGMVYQLAGGDILKENAILATIDTRHAYMHRAYALVKSEFETKMLAKAGK